jgi:DNA-binding NtrC family response regulator
MIMNEELNVAGLPLQFPKPTAGTQLPTLAEWNQRYIEYVLAFTKGKKTAAARILGINRRTLYRRKNGKDSAGEAEMPMRDASIPLASTSTSTSKTASASMQ